MKKTAKDLLSKSFKEEFDELSPEEQQKVLNELKVKHVEKPKPTGFTPEKDLGVDTWK